MIRLLIMWMFATLIFYAWFYLASRREKRTTRKLIYRLVLSALVAAIPVSAFFLINNFSGV